MTHSDDLWDVRVDGDSEDILVLKSHFLSNNPGLREMHFYSTDVKLDWFKGKVRKRARWLRQVFILADNALSACSCYEVLENRSCF
jgi:hypothetical protein